jgi:hypothetical protein
MRPRNMRVVFQPYETIVSPTTMSRVSRIAMKKTSLPERGRYEGEHEGWIVCITAHILLLRQEGLTNRCCC